MEGDISEHLHGVYLIRLVSFASSLFRQFLFFCFCWQSLSVLVSCFGNISSAYLGVCVCVLCYGVFRTSCFVALLFFVFPSFFISFTQILLFSMSARCVRFELLTDYRHVRVLLYCNSLGCFFVLFTLFGRGVGIHTETKQRITFSPLSIACVGNLN